MYAVYWHTVTNHEMIGAVRGRAGAFVLMLYLAPIPCGIISIIFMFKPLFARPARDIRSRSLTEQSDPILFAFVTQICEKVGTPFPKRIDVDYQMNASAGFRSGFWSIFQANDLVLTIGAPLVAGISVRSFAGVLAHEFGHFSQGAGMRLSYLIRVISHWFTRVVYERDQWDVWLEDCAEELDNVFGLILQFSRLFIFLSRCVLWILMMIGHLVSGFLLRQMEFDADQYETQMAGSDQFEITTLSMQKLGAAHSIAVNQLYEKWLNGTYIDNLNEFTNYFESKLTPEIKQEIEQHVRDANTGIFDTHPCDRDRIQHAVDQNSPGIFLVEGSATNLFSYFQKLSKNVTWDLYCEISNKQIDPSKLRPVSEVISVYEQTEDGPRSIKSTEDLPKLKFD
ncbi:MAG: M48 family metallopeptidase [Pirellulales bacterium]